MCRGGRGKWPSPSRGRRREKEPTLPPWKKKKSLRTTGMPNTSGRKRECVQHYSKRGGDKKRNPRGVHSKKNIFPLLGRGTHAESFGRGRGKREKRRKEMPYLNDRRGEAGTTDETLGRLGRAGGGKGEKRKRGRGRDPGKPGGTVLLSFEYSKASGIRPSLTLIVGAEGRGRGFVFMILGRGPPAVPYRPVAVQMQRGKNYSPTGRGGGGRGKEGEEAPSSSISTKKLGGGGGGGRKEKGKKLLPLLPGKRKEKRGTNLLLQQGPRKDITFSSSPACTTKE